MKTIDYKPIAELFSFYSYPTYDAKFALNNGKAHYEKRRSRNEYFNLSEREYFKLAERVSLKNINGRTVRAYKLPNGRVVKCDGKNIVVYYGGKNGTVITLYGAPMARWKQLYERDKRAYNGTEEIIKE